MRWSRNFIIATTILAAVVAISALIVGIIAITNGDNAGAQNIASNGVIAPTPYGKYLAATAGPLAMTWPSDLTPFVTRQYRFYSTSTQAHTIQVTGGATYVGGTTLATFGGAIGDGFMAEVISPTKIVVTSVNNVVFS
jgi:hypothetical protein